MAKKKPADTLLLAVLALPFMLTIALLKAIVAIFQSRSNQADKLEHDHTPAPLNPDDILVVGFVCAVAGTSFDTDGVKRGPFIRSKVNPGDPVELLPEPSNPYDSNAVAVHVHGFKIGYLRRDVAQRHAESIADPALHAVANVRQVARHNPPGVYLNFALYAQRKAVDEGILQINHGRVSRVALAAQYLGRTSTEWLELQPNNLETLLGCCKAELDLFKTRPLADIDQPVGRVFVRTCILSRKQKLYEAEIKLCKAWLAIAEQHDADPLVTAGYRKPLTGAGPHKNIAIRLPKAIELLEAQQAK